MLLRIFIILNILFVDLFSYISIEFSPIEYFIPNYRIKFQATMKEYYHNLDSAKFKFRTSKDSKFYYVEMECSLDNKCEAMIPAPMKSTKMIQYFIEAKDKIGDVYKTQQFAVSQVQLPAWQMDTKTIIKLQSDDLVIDNVALNGFSDKVQFQYQTGLGKKVDSKIHLPQDIMMNQEKEADTEVNFTGIWSIRRTLSTCSSKLYSHKVIKIKSSSDNKIIESKHINEGTKLRYVENKGYVCQLVEDNIDGALVGSDSVYTRQSFLESLQNSMSNNKAVELLEFSTNKIVFNLAFKNTTLTTIYKREKELSFLK